MIEAVAGADGGIEFFIEGEIAGVKGMKFRFGRILSGVAQHFLGGVNAGNTKALLAHFVGQVGVAAADVEDMAAWFELIQELFLDCPVDLINQSFRPIFIIKPGEVIIIGVAFERFHNRLLLSDNCSLRI